MALGHSPRIITDGLVLCLDAANPKNYNLTSVEVLVVAGGGGGGMDMGGGGGGGGVIYNSNVTVTPGSAVTVTVGAGGYGAPAGGGGYRTDGAGPQPGAHQFTIPATNGGNSVFGALTAIGGGAGGSSYRAYTPGIAGSNGGSGGGSSGYNDNAGTFSGGTGTAGQGFAGGNSTQAYYSGGGGGAGGAGVSSPNRPDGGPGVIYPTMSPYYFGGGGGGASYSLSTGGYGGIGGGGGGAVGVAPGGAGLNNGSAGGGGSPNSQTNTPGGNAGANTGGGGGGGSHYNLTNKGGEGGSGIVIVRYPGPQRAIGGTVTSVAGHTIHTFTTVGSTTFTPLVGTNNSSIFGLSDFSGNGKFSTTQNLPIFSSGNNGSVLFDGTNEYASCGALSGSFATFTVIIWFYPNSVSNYQNPIDCNYSYNGNTGNVGPRLEMNSSGTLAWNYSNDTAVNNNFYSHTVVSSGLAANTWHCAAITYDGVTSTTYYNGNSTGISRTLVGTPTGFVGVMNNINLGRGFHLGGAERPFNGRVAQTQIYNRALTSAEVLQNYNASKGRYEKGGINNPFSSPSEARVLGYSSGDYYFKSGSMSSAQLLEFQRDYYENRGWVCVFRSSYASTATTNKIDLSIPMGGLLVQRDALDLRGAVYWSTPITYNTVSGGGNNTADSGTGYAGSNARRVILGGSGGHGIYNTGQSQCNWGSSAGAIGAGWDGSTCGTFPNGLIWGTGNASTATYDNRSGTWSHWITW